MSDWQILTLFGLLFVLSISAVWIYTPTFEKWRRNRPPRVPRQKRQKVESEVRTSQTTPLSSTTPPQKEGEQRMQFFTPGREYDYGTGGKTSLTGELRGKLGGLTAIVMAVIIRGIFQLYLSSALMDWRIQGSALTITAGLWVYGALQEDPEEHHGAVNLALIIWAITLFV